ncbi:LPXTG-motif cell wall anchor domain-containing protein [Ruminococcaceae bacterium KH2T8]|nr:LPXTG-motif cell wall anchor domain-containing protein [Ruminococcaceae bacterium KH2T8]
MAKTKETFKRILATVIATVIGLTPIASGVRVNAWGTPISSGTIHMTDSSRSAELFNSNNENDTISCNAKAVERDGSWVPVYCIEKGKSLNTGDTVNAEMYENGDWCDQYDMSVRDAVGMIYVCGYNGENGWGVTDTNIYNRDASADELMSNGNYQKYVATQALIWEAVSGNTYYSRNDTIQGEINVLRGRISNYRNRSVRGADSTGNISLYRSSSDAQANPNGPTAVEGNGTAHFAYQYDGYTPANSRDHWGPVVNYNGSDLTTTTVNELITFEWKRVYNGGVEAGQGGEVIYDLDDNDAGNLWGVILWRPENGNQLCVSATGTAEKVYASFMYDYEREDFQAGATITTVKVDDLGNPSRGATFTVYNSDGSVFGTMTDANNDGHYSISLPFTVFGDDGTRYYHDETADGTPITSNIVRNFTVRETSPATEVKIDGSWRSATFAANDTTYSINITLTRTGVMTWTATGTSGGTSNRSGKTTTATIAFGTSGQNGNTVNYQQINANATFTIKKEDEQGHDARGATFGVYTNTACTTAAEITLSDPDGDGIYTSSQITWGNRSRTATAQPGIYYIREISPATEIKVNGSWRSATCELDTAIRTVRVVWNPADGSITAYLYEGAISNFGNATALVTKTGSYNGVTSTVSADFTSKPWKNTPYVYANADFSILKVDDQGRAARGAVFTVYSDEACTNTVGTMSDPENNGHYVYSGISFTRQLRTVSSQQTKVYYIRETSPATEILFDGEWIEIDCASDDSVRKITITWTPSSGAISTVLECGDDSISVPGSYDETTFTSTVHADFSTSPVVNPITSTGSMRIEKYDAETGERLTGATFCVYNDVNGNGSYDDGDTVYVEVLTDDDGDGIYLLEEMPIDHSYLVIETEAPEYYETDPNYYGFRLTPRVRDYTVDNMTWPVVEGIQGEFLNHNPIVGTTLTDAETLEHVTIVREEITLVDTVEYNGLHVGETYVMCGTLYDKESGEEITTADVTFTPESVDGTVDVIFTVNTEVARNCTFVAGERVRHEGSEKWVGIHFDLEDEGQTVRVPDIHTTLTDNSTDDHVAAYPTVELTDVITYENLVPGLEYTVTGYLMDKNTNEALKDANCNVVTATVSFTPEEEDGQVEVTYTFDRGLADNTILVAYESLYYGDVLIIAHEDIDDVDQTVYVPQIHTTLLGQDTDAHVAAQAGSIILIDTVAFSNLLPGKTYTLTGTLVNRDLGDFVVDASGNVISSTVTFTPETANGTVDVVFTFDSSLLNNTTLVAFEELQYNGIRIATHNDITDIDQTVNIPDIGTTLYDQELSDDPDMREMTRGYTEVALVDEVSYENITPGLEYTVFGTLMIKETGEVLRDEDGNPVTASTTFVPETASGTVDVEFTVDLTMLGNKHIVAFETLEYNNVALVIHADLSDENQTVRVPEIGTTLKEDETQDHVGRIDDEIILVDMVSYTGLIPGKTYTVTGVLMNADTGMFMRDSAGEVITSTTEFTANTGSGFVEIEFHIDASLLSGMTVVAFENIDYEGVHVAVHADITDKNQTVYFPEIGTTATVNGEKIFNPSDTITLTDTVSYENLVPGRDYELRGQLMTSAGVPFTCDGNPVISVLRFTPETADGTVDVTFTFSGKDLRDGDRIVVFEQLYLVQTIIGANGERTEETVLITTHEDINDEGQTVTVSVPTTPPPGIPSTGEEGGSMSTVIGLIAVAIGGAIAFVVVKRKRNE